MRLFGVIGQICIEVVVCYCIYAVNYSPFSTFLHHHFRNRSGVSCEIRIKTKY